jgi:hypothetical protein
VATVPDYVPQWAVPFHLNEDGTVATVPQSSADDIDGQIYNVLVCPQGAKLADPTFGVPSPLFDLLNLDTTAIVSAIRTLVPDATTEVVQRALVAVTHPQQVMLDVTAQVTTGS